MLTIPRVDVVGQQDHQGSHFPYALGCPSEDFSLAQTTDWVSENGRELLNLATKHGAVAFRDFPLKDVEAFDALIQAFNLDNFPYVESLSNAVRVNRTPRVFSANEAPPEVTIFFHHEMAQTPLYPRYILFYCEIAAEQGGETPLCRSDVLFERLQKEAPQFASDCETKGLRYTNVMPGIDDPHSGMGRSWQKTLGVETQPEAETRLSQLGYSHEWLEDDCLRATTPTLPAVLEVAPGQKTFFNQLIAAYCGWKDERNDPSDAIRHGDGSKLDPDGVQTAVRLSEELAYDHAWQVGDAVLLDNTVAMHARRSFVGTRKIVASLAQKQINSMSLQDSVSTTS